MVNPIMGDEYHLVILVDSHDAQSAMFKFELGPGIYVNVKRSTDEIANDVAVGDDDFAGVAIIRRVK